MRYNMLGAPQAKILWSAPSKSRFYYLFWLLELMQGHLRRSILRILVLNPTHEISWSRSGFFSLRGRILRAGPPGPLCFLVFVFSPPPSALEAPGRPLNERSKNLRPSKQASLASRKYAHLRYITRIHRAREVGVQEAVGRSVAYTLHPALRNLHVKKLRRAIWP